MHLVHSVNNKLSLSPELKVGFHSLYNKVRAVRLSYAHTFIGLYIFSCWLKLLNIHLFPSHAVHLFVPLHMCLNHPTVLFDCEFNVLFWRVLLIILNWILLLLNLFYLPDRTSVGSSIRCRALPINKVFLFSFLFFSHLIVLIIYSQSDSNNLDCLYGCF